MAIDGHSNYDTILNIFIQQLIYASESTTHRRDRDLIPLRIDVFFFGVWVLE